MIWPRRAISVRAAASSVETIAVDGREHGDARHLDTQRVKRLHRVLTDLHLGVEVRRDVDRGVRDADQAVVALGLDHIKVTDTASGQPEALFAVEQGAHEDIGVQVALHHDIGGPFAYHGDRADCRGVIRGGVDQPPGFDRPAHVAAECQNFGAVPDQSWFGNAQFDRFAQGFQHNGLRGIGNGDPDAGATPGLFDQGFQRSGGGHQQVSFCGAP